MAFKSKTAQISIKKPNFQSVKVGIVGTAPLMVSKFSAKVQKTIEDKQTGKNKVGGPRQPKDYIGEFNGARYIAGEGGWDGFYAGSIRNAMIRAASYASGLTMTAAKGLIFVVAEGFDKDSGHPLIRIRGCEPIHDTRPARNEGGGVDIRNRPRYEGWHALVEIRYDADLLTEQDMLNLLARAGESVGICEGRPSSTNSNGIGFGTFAVKGLSQIAALDVPGKRGRKAKAPKLPAPSIEVPASLVAAKGKRGRKSNGAPVNG